MKIGSVVVNRNDGYKDFERGIIHFKTFLESFDEVNYIDWNSPEGSFLWEIEDQLPKLGKIKHFIIPPEVCNKIILEPTAQQCNEALSRNIGIVRSDCDWIVSTNIDIIPPTREELLKLIETLDKDTFYTISRREAPKDLIYKHKNNISELRKSLSHIPERHFPAKVTANDNYSLINCCGDFQLAHKDVWNKVKGFEEEMIYQCYVDTNIQKKAVLNNFNLKVLYNPSLYHMEHGAYYTKDDGTRVADLENKGAYKGDRKAYNDVYKWVELFQNSKNQNHWGLSNISIEHEII
tara:strand:+ start:645 stop:1523 length:879 start_codon:yes stop_codon:yes gene_type:complete